MTTQASDAHYDDAFYGWQTDGSYRSALQYRDVLGRYLSPRRVIDIGCGRGTWLKAFIEAGATQAVGLDGSWNSQDKMIDQAIDFRQVDLTFPFDISDCERFDLAMSLEVAEHLPSDSSSRFIKSLTALSDTIMFGAAYSNQGGTNHINEQPHTFWAELFVREGYQPFDLFRGELWGNPEVEFWYQQNTFLYVKESSPAFSALISQGQTPLGNLAFLNCVHPQLFEIRRTPTQMSPESIVGWTQLLLEQYPDFAAQIAPLVENARGTR